MRLLSSIMSLFAASATTVFSSENADAILKVMEDTHFFIYEDESNADQLREHIQALGINGMVYSNRYISLDPESIAEEGIFEALQDIGQNLSMRGAYLTSMSLVKSDHYNYEVKVNNKHYIAYDAETVSDSWPLATETFFRIVNDLLSAKGSEKLYAISPDTTEAMILPSELIKFYDILPSNQRPFIPNRIGPDFGARYE